MIAFEYKSRKYPIKLTYWDSVHVLPEEFNINLSKMFTDERECIDVMHKLLLNDEIALKLMWHYMKDQASFTWDELLQQLEPKDLDRFREDFWSAVLNFSGSLRRNLLEQLWTEFKKDLKTADLASKMSGVSSSDSPQEE